MNTDDELRWLRAALISSEKFPKMMSAMITIPPIYVDKLIDMSSTFQTKLQSQERQTVQTLNTCGFEKFDACLLYKCIRYFQLVKEPSQKWGNIPLSESETTQGDDVERMRTLRNKTFHVANAVLNETEYMSFIAMCDQIANRLDGFLQTPQNGFMDEIRRSAQRTIMDTVTERNYMSLLEECVCLRQEQCKQSIGRYEVTFYYGKDVESHIGCESNAGKKYIMYISGTELEDDAVIRKLLAEIEKKIKNIKVSRIQRGSIILHVQINMKAISTKSSLNISLFHLVDQLIPYFSHYREDGNKIEVRLCVDDYIFDETPESLTYLSESKGKANCGFSRDVPRSLVHDRDALHDVIFDSANEVLGNSSNENETNKKTQLDIVLTTKDKGIWNKILSFDFRRHIFTILGNVWTGMKNRVFGVLRPAKPKLN